MSAQLVRVTCPWPCAAALAAALTAMPAALAAQEPVAPAASPAPALGPPVQRIATASAVSTERIGYVLGVRELPDARVLVNDGGSRRLLLMDTAMKTVEVVLDSVSAAANTYGTRQGALIPFRGDSTLFVDAASYAMLLLDPAGKVVRVRSVWRVQDVPYFTGMAGGSGLPGVDARGRVVYRVPARPAPPRVAPPAGVPYFPQEPDSAFVVAADLDTRKVDTLGVVRIPRQEMSLRVTPGGGFAMDIVTNPLPATDEWAVLADGGVAFVRGRDYRIEYLNPDGTRASSAKLPYPWQRLSDEDKQRLVDSVKTQQQRAAVNDYVTAMIRWVNQFGRSYPAGLKIPDGYVVPPGLPKEWHLPAGVKVPDNYVYACPPGEDASPAMLLAGPVPGAPSPSPPASPPQGAARAAPPPVPVAGAVRAAASVAPVPGVPAAGAPVAGAAAGLPGPPRCFPAPVSFTSGRRPPPPTPRTVRVVPASDLPDYRPPILAASVRADMDGNLWIRTVPVKPVPGGAVFDIVSRAGVLVNRLQLPPGYTVAGFGRGKVVYLSMRDAAGIHLARVRLK